MTHVYEVSREDLVARRKEILSKLSLTYDELKEKAEGHRLVADEWAAWEEIREIDFLLEGA